MSMFRNLLTTSQKLYIYTDDGYRCESKDGINWGNYVSINSEYIPYNVAYGKGVYVGSALKSSSNSYTLYTGYSYDGINWVWKALKSNSNTIFKPSYPYVKYVNGIFYLMGEYSLFYYSKNGINWTKLSVQAPEDICFGEGLFVKAGQYGDSSALEIGYSYDGINWVDKEISSTDWHIYSIAYGNGIFVAVGGDSDDSVILKSEDGINWTRDDTLFSRQLSGIMFGNGIFVLLHNGITLYYSTDGVNWTSNFILDNDSYTVFPNKMKIFYKNKFFYFNNYNDEDNSCYTIDGTTKHPIYLGHTHTIYSVVVGK